MHCRSQANDWHNSRNCHDKQRFLELTARRLFQREDSLDSVDCTFSACHPNSLPIHATETVPCNDETHKHLRIVSGFCSSADCCLIACLLGQVCQLTLQPPAQRTEPVNASIKND